MEKVATARMSISMPTTEPQALFETCMDLKQAVEQMLGRYVSEADTFGYRARMVVSRETPPIERDGEFWLSEGETNTLSVSYAGKWRKLGVLTA